MIKVEEHSYISRSSYDAELQEESEDLLNYKGQYFEEEGGDTTKKYMCPTTGSHFEFLDMCRKLEEVKKKRV